MCVKCICTFLHSWDLCEELKAGLICQASRRICERGWNSFQITPSWFSAAFYICILRVSRFENMEYNLIPGRKNHISDAGIQWSSAVSCLGCAMSMKRLVMLEWTSAGIDVSTFRCSGAFPEEEEWYNELQRTSPSWLLYECCRA